MFSLKDRYWIRLNVKITDKYKFGNGFKYFQYEINEGSIAYWLRVCILDLSPIWFELQFCQPLV